MPHLLGDFGHGQHFFAVEISEKKKLGERHVTWCELLAEAQHKTTLHFQNDMGKPFGISTNFIGRTSCKRGNRSHAQGDKTRNARVTCQFLCTLVGTPRCAVPESVRGSAASLPLTNPRF